MRVSKYVYEDTTNSNHGRKRDKPFEGKFKYKNTAYRCGWYSTIKEAQIAVDIKRLSLGLDAALLKKK